MCFLLLLCSVSANVKKFSVYWVTGFWFGKTDGPSNGPQRGSKAKPGSDASNGLSDYEHEKKSHSNIKKSQRKVVCADVSL